MNIYRHNLPIASLTTIAVSIIGQEATPALRDRVPTWLVNTLEGVLVFAFWIALALVVNFLIDRLIWPRLFGPNIPGQPRERKLVMQLVLITMLGLAVGLAMKQLLSPELGTMVAGSGVIVIVLGLALQSTLSDFFAGVSLNLERPFKAGQWITLDDNTDGLVLTVNWRATHIRTRTLDVLVVPNSVVARSRLINRVQPATLHISNVYVKLMPGFDLELFKISVTPPVLSVKGVKDSPAPLVLVDTFGDWTVGIRVYFFIEDYSALVVTRGEVANTVYQAIVREEGLRRYLPRAVVGQAGAEVGN